MSRWWGAGADRGDTERLEAFSDGVLAIAITLLILDVRVEVPPGTSLAAALGHLARAELLVAGLRPEFVRDVTVRYLLGLAGFTVTHRAGQRVAGVDVRARTFGATRLRTSRQRRRKRLTRVRVVGSP